MKLLVTGGAGYVGSHTVRELCEAGHDVTVYDNLSQGHRGAVDRRAMLVEADLADSDRLDEAFADGGFDGVLHFAAHLDVGESVREPLKYYRNNVANSVALLEAMNRHGVRKMVFSSTCATYGQVDGKPVTEETPQLPISPYGRTKLAIEWAMLDSATAWGLGGCALRYFNASGAAADGSIGEDHDPEIHLIPIILEVAAGKRDHIQIFGDDYPTPDGTCVRDYIHVEDLAVAHRLAIESQNPGEFRAFNVGTGLGSSVKQVVEAAREITEHPIPAVHIDRRPGDPAIIYANATRIQDELNWLPSYRNVADIVATAWAWHREHPNGFDD